LSQKFKRSIADACIFGRWFVTMNCWIQRSANLTAGLTVWTALLTGCGESQRTLGAGTPMANHPIARARMYDDIYKVVKFFPAMPWLSFDPDGDPDPEGFKVTVYLISSSTRAGEFADGVIHVKMWGGQPSASGAKGPPLLKEWTLTPEEVLPYRVVRRTLLGHGYQLRLNWGDVDALGKSIRIQIDFERKDGRIIRGQAHELRVPRSRTSRSTPTAADFRAETRSKPSTENSG